MFDNIDEIYITNNTEGKKYKNWILPIVIGLAVLMFILILSRKIILSYVSVLVVVLLMIILKISIIDTLKEGIDQIYRVLYNKKNNKYGNDKEVCFKDLPELYSKLKNRECFKEIRAMFISQIFLSCQLTNAK